MAIVTTALTEPPSTKKLWVDRMLTILAVLFMTFDAIAKVIRAPQAVQATTAQLGFPESAVIKIGLLLLGCTLVYVIPRTAPLGGLLLTGYLGGATAANVRVGDPLFETMFPILFAIWIWATLILRDDRLRVLLPGGQHP